MHKRLELYIPTEKYNEIETRMNEYKIGSKREFLNMAINLFMWSLKEKKAGRIIASVDEDDLNYKELILPL